jgi:glycerol-3-phosphate acyltransferase PlsY
MPIANGLRPRRGVSWSGFLLLVADWRLFLICAAAFLIATAASRRASLGALAASALFPVFVGVFYGGWLMILLAAGCSVMVIAMYGKSLMRLLLGGGGRRSASASPDGGESAER